MSLAATQKSSLMTPHQRRLPRVAAVDPSSAATLLSLLMSLLFFILIFSYVISGNLKVSVNDLSSAATI
jgi:hypothetical protein